MASNAYIFPIKTHPFLAGAVERLGFVKKVEVNGPFKEEGLSNHCEAVDELNSLIGYFKQ